MPRDYANAERTAVRRSDRAVDDERWIKAFLHSASMGTLATVHDGQPFVNSNLYVYDEAEHCIYTHTARLGRTRSNVEASERVCFTVTEMGRMLPADEALEFSVEYAGVVVFGRASLVEDQKQAVPALQMLLDKYAPHLTAGSDYRPPVEEEVKRTAVFRIDIEEWSGKKKQVEDFPGAYWYQEQPVLPSVQARHAWQGTVQAVYIAPGAAAPMVAVGWAEAVTGKGLVGDRYFNEAGTFSNQAGTGRALTLFAVEDLQAMARENDLLLPPEEARRNILTEGVPLNYLVGKRFMIGEVVLEGIRLAEPCDHLSQLTGEGMKLMRAMHHRGGLRADIIKGGPIKPGDSVLPLAL